MTKTWADDLHDAMARQQYEREDPLRAHIAERRAMMDELEHATSGDNDLLRLALDAVRQADREPLYILPRKEKRK